MKILDIINRWTSFNPFHAQRDLVKALAHIYELGADEGEIFDELWKVYKKARKVEHAREGELDVQVARNLGRLAKVARGGSRNHLDFRGHRHVRRLPLSNRYVVFSDHHIAHTGHRQDFFESSGNRELYREVLERYYDEDYWLIENGDVEELVIFEPTLARARRWAELAEEGWAALNRARLRRRKHQLERVIESNQAFYDQVRDSFHAAGRLVRVAGNHDQDLQEDSLLAVFRQQFAGLSIPADYIVLEDPGCAISDKYIIAHGHQYDRITNPKFARRLGESISECLAWAFQGADRNWKWNDGPRQWVSGERYLNHLVTDDARTIDVGRLVLGELELRDLDEAVWESLFAHNVAWNYFESPTRSEAVLTEVFGKDEFFKYRHLDEENIADGMSNAFDDGVPTLVLGHSHEPRRNSWDARSQTSFDHYLNSGAAGRFENLIWALEIVDGVSEVVAWYRPGGAVSGGPPARAVFEPRGTHFVARAEVLPVDTTDAWLPAMLHPLSG